MRMRSLLITASQKNVHAGRQWPKIDHLRIYPYIHVIQFESACQSWQYSPHVVWQSLKEKYERVDQSYLFHSVIHMNWWYMTFKMSMYLIETIDSRTFPSDHDPRLLRMYLCSHSKCMNWFISLISSLIPCVQCSIGKGSCYQRRHNSTGFNSKRSPYLFLWRDSDHQVSKSHLFSLHNIPSGQVECALNLIGLPTPSKRLANHDRSWQQQASIYRLIRHEVQATETLFILMDITFVF